MDTLKIFCSYAQKDKSLMERLHTHMRILELNGVSIWGMHTMLPGTNWGQERDSYLHAANIVLLLISADFISSPEQYQKEALPAIERHNKGEAHVIPIILRAVRWQGTPFGNLHPLPADGKPITDPSWKTRDHAFLDVVLGIQRVINDGGKHLPTQQKNDNTTLNSQAATDQLEQIIRDFKLLRSQIASFVFMQGPKDFTLERCENRYNKLYGDTMVFLATYLPQCVSNDSEGFVEIVYRKAAEQLHKRGNVYVSLTRWIISPLAKLEKVAEQIDACTATLELYKQKYFNDSPHV